MVVLLLRLPSLAWNRMTGVERQDIRISCVITSLAIVGDFKYVMSRGSMQ
jgi:hypothetical protein